MLGYTEEDVLRMMACINLVNHYIPSNSSNDELRDGLQEAYSFFDGILAEGRV